MFLLLNVVTYLLNVLTGKFDYTYSTGNTNMYFPISGIEFTEIWSVTTSIFIFHLKYQVSRPMTTLNNNSTYLNDVLGKKNNKHGWRQLKVTLYIKLCRDVFFHVFHVFLISLCCLKLGTNNYSIVLDM